MIFVPALFKNLEGFKGDVIAADVTNLDLKHYFGGRKVDLVFHLASITDTTDHNQFRQVHDNVESWRNLLDYFEGRKTRFVYASSAATYGIAAGINKVDQPPKPANVYAFSKVQLDKPCPPFCARQSLAGRGWIALLQRLRSARGAQGPGFQHDLATGATDPAWPTAAHFQEWRANPRLRLCQRTSVNCTILAARARVSGIYNAGSGLPRSFNDIVSNLNRVLNTQWQPE